MLVILLYTWALGTLFTTGVTIELRRRETEAQGYTVMLGLLMLVMACVAWPIMLGVAVGAFLRDQTRMG